MSREKFEARDLLRYEPLELKGVLPNKFTLIFEDGEIETTRWRTLVSAFFWAYHHNFKNIPLLKKHHIQEVIKGGFYDSSSHTALCENIESTIYEVYGDDDPTLIENLSYLAYRSSMEMVNKLMPDMSAYVAPLGVIDAIQIQRHPRIQAELKMATPQGERTEKIYSVVRNVVMECRSLEDNGLAFGFRANTVKRDQVLQSVSALGRRNEPDGRLYKYSVNTGYLEGMTTVYNMMAESRGAPKALMAQEDPLKKSEYMARRLQFLVTPVRSIVGKDCGSTDYVDWLVDPEVFDDDGTLISKGGIGSMRGKFILANDTSRLIELTGKEKDLNGHYVRMRSVLTCKNENPHTVCRTCFGGLSRNYYRHQNLGHLCAVTITERITQNTLSVKHLVSSANSERIILTGISSRFFKIGKTKSDFVIPATLKRLQLKLVLGRNEALNLLDIVKMKNLDDLRVDKASRISQIQFIVRDKGIETPEFVEVRQGNRFAYMTIELIKYIKENGYMIDGNNNFVIDLEKWDYSQSVLAVPQMEISFSQHGQEIAKMIESSMKEIDERQKPGSPLSTLKELDTLVNSKLDAPLSCLEVIVYASMIPNKNIPALARGWKNPILGVARQIINNRTMSVPYVYQGHEDFMLNARSFFPHYRVSNQMDVFFAPKEVVKDKDSFNDYI